MICQRHMMIPLAAILAIPVSADEIRINQLQVIGTHNSYHIEPSASMLQLIGATSKDLPRTLQYTHRPLPEQFVELGMRSIELDVFADPKGGLYANPRGRAILEAQKRSVGPDPDSDGQLTKPGFKVLHVQDIDYLTTVSTFDGALKQVREFSDQHPLHVPLFVLIELKDDVASPLLTTPVKFDTTLLDDLDTVIRSVFSDDRLITPDAVRGSHDTLRDAVTSDGWPTLNDSRGQVMFALDNPGHQRDLYLKNHPSLEGRVLFVDAKQETNSEAAFFKLNDPISDFDRIQKLVQSGFIVRTRADASTVQSRSNDTTRRDQAFASGAQIISTDYPEADTRFSDYAVRFPNGRAVRSNPVNGTGAPITDVDQ